MTGSKSTPKPAPVAADKTLPELSVIVPMYNETNVLDIFFGRMEKVLAEVGLSYEIICVNDGSQDNTLDRLKVERLRNPAIKIVDLARNFGKEIALTAGIDASCGRGVIPIDADLQDPPELISQLVEKWHEGYDVVYAERATRDTDTWVKRTTAGLFYKIYNTISDVHIPPNAGDFRLMDRRVVEHLKQVPETKRFMKGLFAWVGFKQIGVPFAREERAAGGTAWNYWKLWNFALDAITSFSTVPLRVWSYIGFLVSMIAFGYGSYLIVRTLVSGVDLPGYASLMVVVLFLGGVQLITLGVIGEYLGRIFVEVKHRPLYIVNRTHGIDAGEPTHGSN